MRRSRERELAAWETRTGVVLLVAGILLALLGITAPLLQVLGAVALDEGGIAPSTWEGLQRAASAMAWVAERLVMIVAVLSAALARRLWGRGRTGALVALGAVALHAVAFVAQWQLGRGLSIGRSGPVEDSDWAILAVLQFIAVFDPIVLAAGTIVGAALIMQWVRGLPRSQPTSELPADFLEVEGQG